MSLPYKTETDPSIVFYSNRFQFKPFSVQIVFSSNRFQFVLSRYSDGVIPVSFLKHLLKYLGSEKPTI